MKCLGGGNLNLYFYFFKIIFLHFYFCLHVADPATLSSFKQCLTAH